jgi:tetratricopeptide (TPR) repeat protein
MFIKEVKYFFVLVNLLIFLSFSCFIQAAKNPTESQQIAIKRIENFRDYFRKTGDFKSKLDELHQAEKELSDSYHAFISSSNSASAALSQIKLGDIQRMQNNWEKAKVHYQQAYTLAKKADHNEYQAIARLNQAKTEQFALDEAKRMASEKDHSGLFPKLRSNYSGAQAYAREAVQLASELNNAGVLFDALEVQGNILLKSGDLETASSVFNQAISAAKNSGDETRILFAFYNQAGLSSEKAFRCGSVDFKGGYSMYCPKNDTTSWCGDRPYQDSYLSCYKAHDEALSDYEQSLKLAKKLGFKGLEQLMEEQVENLENQKCLTNVKECRDTGNAKIAPLVLSGKISEQRMIEELNRVNRECKLACVNKLPEGMRILLFQQQ